MRHRFAFVLPCALACAPVREFCVLVGAGGARTAGGSDAQLCQPPRHQLCEIGLVRAEARVIHGGGRMATSDARLTGPDGKLYAHGSTTCFIFDVQ